MSANSFTANNPDDLWCVDHNTYTDRCLYLHDRANSDALPDPWPDARPGPEDDPDGTGAWPDGRGCGTCEQTGSVEEDA